MKSQSRKLFNINEEGLRINYSPVNAPNQYLKSQGQSIIPKNVKAIICSKYGSPEKVLSIKEVDKPTPKENEVLVRVYAATVSRTDCGILWGRPFILRFFIGLSRPKSITGSDFAGVIESVGRDVAAFKVGDRVWGFDDSGLRSHAEYLTFPENKGIDIIPDHITFEQAAASIEGGHYAVNFINKVEIKESQKILVNGATGAIGSACVQFLKSYNAKVTAVCGSDGIEIVKSMGADKVIDYTKTDFTKDDEQYDFVFDAVGKSSFGKCKPLLKPGGVYISSELGPRNENPLLALTTSLFGEKKVKFPFPYNIKESMLFIKTLLEKGKYNPLIDKSFKLEDVPDAFNYADSGKKLGSIIISIKT